MSVCPSPDEREARCSGYTDRPDNHTATGTGHQNIVVNDNTMKESDSYNTTPFMQMKNTCTQNSMRS